MGCRASETAPEAVRQAVGGGCQSGWGRLLSVTNAIEAGTWRQGDSGWALAGRFGGGGGGTYPPSNASLMQAPQGLAWLMQGQRWGVCAGLTGCRSLLSSIMVGHRYWMPPPRQFQPMFQVLSTINCYATSSR